MFAITNVISFDSTKTNAGVLLSDLAKKNT